MIGYYIHHQGRGHLSRATSICRHLRGPVTALTSLDLTEPHPFAATVTLTRDDTAETVAEPTAHGALHWAPHHDAGLSRRMQQIAQWVADARPAAVVVDVSVEVATFIRLLGVPVIVVAQPGKRVDAPHLLVHRLADHIIAPWPRELCVPAWLRTYDSKTSYVGGISRFEDRADCRLRSVPKPSDGEPATVLVLGGAGGTTIDAKVVAAAAQSEPRYTWTTLGVPGGPWVSDPWPQICAADVVVGHAGQGCIADIAAAARPAVVLPQVRPFDEQRMTARVLQQHRLAVVAQQWPDDRAWSALLALAQGADISRWQRWQVRGAAARAASAIEETARRCRRDTTR
jgi:UDP-N-acetylglucosamine:LPS N-acetylglucosamine transferase